MSTEELLAYYARRAEEYEGVYKKPERQGELAHLHELLPRLLRGCNVLEVACGTGYWTHVVAPAARSLLATDQSMEMLEIARRKCFPPGRVRLVQADAYNLAPLREQFTGGLAAFWWSHVPKQDLPRFLAGFHEKLTPPAPVVFIDNRYVEGSSTPIWRVDSEGNTYQQRTLRSGSRHEVLKNFPTASELLDAVRAWADAPEVCQLSYYWILRYQCA